MNSGSKRRGSAGWALAKVIAHQGEGGAAEQQRGGEDQHGRERTEFCAERAQRRRRRVGTQPAMLVFGMTVMVMRAVDRERSVRVCVGANDDRPHTMLEARHVSRRPQQAQPKEQREQRRAH